MLTRRLARSDGGFTLVELLMTIAIMGVITVPIANLAIQGFGYYATTQTRIADSHDIQIATAYFSQDVANTGRHDDTNPASPLARQSVWTSGFPTPYCGSSLTGTLTPVVLLVWDTFSYSGTGSNESVSRETDSAAYIAVTTNGSTTLRRAYCTGTPVTGTVGTPNNTTPAIGTNLQTNTLLVQNYDLSDPGNTVPVTCPGVTSCASTSPLPSTVSFTISVKSGTDTVPLRATLSGNRRQT